MMCLECKNSNASRISAAGTAKISLNWHQMVCTIEAGTRHTESSKPLQKKLQSRGFTTADGSIPSDSSFSFVSLLNVLDRTDDPHGLLRSAIGAVDAGGGTILMAAVLPFQGIVHGKFGSKRRPINGLKIRGSSRSASFELGFFRFIEAIASEHPEVRLETRQFSHYNLAATQF